MMSDGCFAHKSYLVRMFSLANSVGKEPRFNKHLRGAIETESTYNLHIQSTTKDCRDFQYI